uniref:replication-relaxation family protein n=1 Tax=Actinacidiphila sp. bgisy167 TaxID=3413797 RepID=UPI003D70E254
MGGPARGAGSSGAAHALSVNETVIALLRPKPDLVLLAGEPPAALAAARAAVDGPAGLGSLASYATEVPLPATGTWNVPGRGGAQADIVVTAAQDGVPLLFVEVDNCYETAEELADKLEKYARFFHRQVKDTDGKERAMWRTRWPAPEGSLGYDVPHLPVLLVFHRIGDRNPDRTVPRLADLTRHLWQGQWHRGDGFHSYDQKIPIIATGLNNLREHGPAGAVFWRFGQTGMQSLTDAIGNPHKDAADARAREAQIARQEAYRAEQQCKAEQEAAEREARRPACAQCGAKFPDDRWEAARDYPDPTTHWHPALCEDCESHTRAAALQANRPNGNAVSSGRRWPRGRSAAGSPVSVPGTRRRAQAGAGQVVALLHDGPGLLNPRGFCTASIWRVAALRDCAAVSRAHRTAVVVALLYWRRSASMRLAAARAASLAARARR